MLIASSVASFLPVLILLACPLMMIVMMRGMHGGGQVKRQPGDRRARNEMTLDELKAERDALNEEIGQRAEMLSDH